MLLKLGNNYWDNKLNTKSIALGINSFINHGNKTYVVEHKVNFYVKNQNWVLIRFFWKKIVFVIKNCFLFNKDLF